MFFGYYTPILLLQVFCLYHSYSNRNENKWLWIIIFFPLIGSILYLYDSFYSRKKMINIAEGLKSNFNSNHKLEKLEQELQFTDSVSNKVELADEYINIQNYGRAIELLESCLNGLYKDDPNILMKLVKANYLQNNYKEVIKYGEQILKKPEFKNSDEKVALAWSYKEANQLEAANQQFEEVDVRFSNYNLRIEYARFHEETGNVDGALDKLEEMLTEIDSMTGYEKKHKKQVYRTIKNYYSELNRR